MKQLTAIAIILLFTACARKAHTEKSISTASKDSTYRFVDSTKTIVATKITEVTNYGGDSLQGNLFFSEPFADSLLYNQSDSLESNGIKVKVTIQPQKGGGFKANIKANAKPKSTNKSTELYATKQKGVSASGKVTTDTKTIDKAKTTASEGFPWGWLIAAIGFVSVALFLINKYVK